MSPMYLTRSMRTNRLLDVTKADKHFLLTYLYYEEPQATPTTAQYRPTRRLKDCTRQLSARQSRMTW